MASVIELGPTQVSLDTDKRTFEPHVTTTPRKLTMHAAVLLLVVRFNNPLRIFGTACSDARAPPQGATLGKYGYYRFGVSDGAELESVYFDSPLLPIFGELYELSH